ncbi:MAG: UDP-glucose--hexose-1-phosphate uridylyltransferase [Clostridia bacterium]|nr:UDP-glucose--hexose-1-phosphate uridylyltransferase [Clostridia bacterium]
MNVNYLICELIEYGVRRGLISEPDRTYVSNRIMKLLGVKEFSPLEVGEVRELADILAELCRVAYENGEIESDSVAYTDLFDTALMGELLPRPSDVLGRFFSLYSDSPEAATDYFYKLAFDSNYIRGDRIKKDLKWTVDSEYGVIDITVNLSKPEKDPHAIAAARQLPQSGYPKCALCHENEGYAGDLSHAARQTLRQIPMDLAGERWYFQYSPYVYYNEHCIALSGEHTPMKISEKTFERLFDFLDLFPHYFIGSNSDLPITGGSILSHEHMQGGRYEFAMERAKIDTPVTFADYPEVDAGIVKWPLSVIRLSSKSRDKVSGLATKILAAWRDYTDEDAEIFAFTAGQMHNTITPIARKRGEKYELDVVLRNNITTDEHPLGLYHPHAEHQNIKKENIGLIEVMGLAVLPARLKGEMEDMKHAILSGTDFAAVKSLVKHKEWFLRFSDKYDFNENNIDEILKLEVGSTFVRAIGDSGVFKGDEEGRAAFLRFIHSLDGTV